MLFLTHDDVKRVLTIETCIEAQEAAILGVAQGKVLPQKAREVNIPSSDERITFSGFEGFASYFLFNSGGIVFDLINRMAVLRIYSQEHGFTTVQGKVRRKTAPHEFHLVLLVDIDHNQLVCMMQERAMGSPRVGAMAGIGIKQMARQNSKTIGILGSGSIARPSLAAACVVRPIKSAKVYSPTPAHRQEFAEAMSKQLAIEVRAVPSAEEAASGVDILVSATNTAEPTFDPAWLDPGTHVHCVHGWEYDERMLQRADLVAWGYPGARETAYGAHSYQDSPEPNTIVLMRRTLRWDLIEKYVEKRVYMTDILTGKAKGRDNDGQITFCASPAGGTAGIAQFAVLAPTVYQLAKKQGIGHELADEWFDNESYQP